MAGEVANGRKEATGRVLDMSKANVAVMAEKTANGASLVAVIHSEITATLICALTNRALTVLGRVHGLILVIREPILRQAHLLAVSLLSSSPWSPAGSRRHHFYYNITYDECQ